MKKKLDKIAKDTNLFLKEFVKKQKKSELMIPMKYGLFSGGKKIRSKILIDIGSIFKVNYKFAKAGCLIALFFKRGKSGHHRAV